METQFLKDNPGSYLLANALVLTGDAQDHGGKMSLVIQDGRVVDLGPDPNVLHHANPDAVVFDCRHLLLLPGFVNAHLHPESFLFGDLTMYQPLSAWMGDQRYLQRSAAASERMAGGLATTLASMVCTQHLRCGVTTASHVLPPLSREALAELRIVERSFGVTVHGVLTTWDHISAAKPLSRQTGYPVSISFGGENDFTVYRLDNIARAAVEQGIRLTAHIGESHEEAEEFRRNFKKSLLGILQEIGLLTSSLHVVHLNQGSDADARLAAEAGAVVTLCLRSALRKRTGYPFLRFLGKAPVRLSIGTDWGGTDILGEIKLLHDLAFLFRGVPLFTPLELVRMATLHGAMALGLEHERGSIERGKHADFVAFALTPLHRQRLPEDPSALDLASLVVHELDRADIAYVVSDGVIRYRLGDYPGVDVEKVVQDFRFAYAALGGTLPMQDQPAPRAKIIPFVQQGTRAGDLDGLSEGFSVQPAGKTPESPRSQPPPPTSTPAPVVKSTDRPIRKPELGKNVRRVFGDDDDDLPPH